MCKYFYNSPLLTVCRLQDVVLLQRAVRLVEDDIHYRYYRYLTYNVDSIDFRYDRYLTYVDSIDMTDTTWPR